VSKKDAAGAVGGAVVSTVIRTRVFGSSEIGSAGRNTVPSNVASIVLTMSVLAMFLKTAAVASS
jgi:hypothetical protein